MKTLNVAALILVSAQTLLSCELPVVYLQYGFESNVTQISGSIGSFIRLQCIADPPTDVASYLWERNEVDLIFPFEYYTITSLDTEDGGLYRCGVVTTSCGTVHSPEVSINTAPNDVMASGPSSVTEGQSFQLTCSAIGWPLPSFEWVLNGNTVDMDSEYSVVSASTSDSGEYTCVARNIRGESTAKLDLTVEATVTSPPPTQAQTTSTDQSEVFPTPTKPPSSTAVIMTTSKSTTTTATTTRESGNESSSSSTDVPVGPFVFILAVAIAMLAALVAVICIVFGLVIYMIKNPSRKKKAAVDKQQLLEQQSMEEGDMEMMDGVVHSRDPDTGKSPVSYVNVAFEEDEEDGESGSASDVSLSGKGSQGGQKMSPQRYQQTSPKKSSPHSQQLVSLPHSISMDVPQRHEARGSPSPKRTGHKAGKGSNVPRSKSMGEPGQLRPAQHLTPPVDKHKMGRQRASEPAPGKRKVLSTSEQRTSVPPLTASAEKLHLKAVVAKTPAEMESGQHLPPAVSQSMAQDTAVTQLAMSSEDEEKAVGPSVITEAQLSSPATIADDGEKERKTMGEQEGEEERAEEEMRTDKDDRGGREGEDEELTTTHITTEDEEEEEEEEEEKHGEQAEGEGNREEIHTTAVVIEQKMGEASVTFEQEGSAGDLFQEDEAAMVSSGEEEDREGVDKEREGEREEEREEDRERVGEVEKKVRGEGVQDEREEEVVKDEKEGIKEEERERVKEEEGEDEEKEEEEEEGRGEVRVIQGEEDKWKDEERDSVEDKEGKEEGAEEPNIHRMSVFIEKAKRMGRSVSYVAQLDRSHPLNFVELQELVEKTVDDERGGPLVLEYNTVPLNSLQSLPLTIEEKHKNRYRNVLPNPHTAVRLEDTGAVGSSYINANYIRGYGGRENVYIATQGPIPNSVPDFWRMVWEKDVSIVVMTTPLVERGKQKCVKYWPSSEEEDTAVYGNIVVRNNFEEVTEFYKISYLSIYRQSPEGEELAEEKDVYHFWYTAWADFSVPKETASILRLREAVNVYRDPQSGPLVVHCSAGLGRSGAFMAIDMGIQQYEQEGTVDPLRYMCEMRQDRGGIIQTADQYIYIHKVLKDYMASKPQ